MVTLRNEKMDSGVKRQMTSDESDSHTEMGDRRPKRNRREKILCSFSEGTSGDGSTLICFSVFTVS
jgi:hypothetical protein